MNKFTIWLKRYLSAGRTQNRTVRQAGGLQSAWDRCSAHAASILVGAVAFCAIGIAPAIAVETPHAASGIHSTGAHGAGDQGAAPHGTIEHHANLSDLFWPAVNFIAYFSILVVIYRKAGKPALRSRKVLIEQHLQRAAGQLADAERAMNAAERRLEELDSEQERVFKALAEEGARTAQSLLDKAEQTAVTVQADGRRMVRGELEKAEAHIRRQVVQTAGRVAREQLMGKISGEDDARLRREALEALFTR